MLIRNYVHHVYNFYRRFSISEYSDSLSRQKLIGISEIEHAGRRLSKSQTERAKLCVDEIHNNDMEAVLYTGTFGTEDLFLRNELKKWTQKNIFGNPVSYGNGLRSAMMCPQSSYVNSVLIPEILNTLENIPFDSVFFDIPWIMKNACYCINCNNDERSKQNLVRNSLELIVSSIKKEFPEVKLGINSSAPTINNNYYSGAHITNLEGLFETYVSEWNPLRWNQSVKVLNPMFKEIKKHSKDSQLFHATTITDKSGRIFEEDLLKKLFSIIDNADFSLRLGINPHSRFLEVINASLPH